MNHNVVSAVFDNHAEAQRAVEELRASGVRENAISIVGRDGENSSQDSDTGHGNVLRGILGGGALGAGLGVAALAIPGVGPLTALGAIAASAVPGALGIGAAAGAAAGTLNEVLKAHGVSDEDAGYYHDRLSEGGIFVSVDADDAGISNETAREILYRHGGHSAGRARATEATI